MGRLNKARQKSYIPPAGVVPKCPHCRNTLEGIFTQQIAMGLGKAWVYFCTSCHNVLGCSQRKGFWMG